MSTPELNKAAQIAAISLAHVCAGWLHLNLSGNRANYLLDQIEPYMDWKMQRYSK